MCIAILNKKSAGTLSTATIYNSWENNDHGAGLLWNSKGELHSFKTYEYYSFLSKYMELREDSNVDSIVLHFRISTSGFKGEHNLHPFMTNDNLGFVHNGVISGLGNNEFSDTYEFNEKLKLFKHDFVNCEATKEMIEDNIGYSKLIFLNHLGEHNIFNEHLGKWDGDNWYSNDSYKAVYSYHYAGNTKVSKAKNYADKESVLSANDYGLTYFSAKSLTPFEYELYEEICNEYAYDPKEPSVEIEIEWLMDMNNCVDIYALWDVLFSGASNDYEGFEYAWDELDEQA